MTSMTSMTDLTGIGALTICSSSKFYETAQALAKEMTDAGLTVFTPRFDFNEEVVEVAMADKISLTHEFLRKIDRSDAIYVIDQDGYTGRSVCIEIGYASALGKTVVLSEPPAENAVCALTTDVVSVGNITKRIRP
jgi:nucleoside 2-deoxyribosyltransferase